MSFLKKIRFFVLCIFLPLVATFACTICVFIIGVRAGTSMQLGQDIPLLEECAGQLQDIKRQTAVTFAEQGVLDRTEFCDNLCSHLTSSTEGAIVSFGGYGVSKNHCICPFEIDSGEKQ